MNTINLIILGAGGHAKVLIDCIRLNPIYNIIGIIDIDPKMMGKTVLDIPVIGDEDKLLNKYPPDRIQLVNGVGSIASMSLRANLFKKFKNAGYNFLKVIHPNVYVGSEVTIAEGAQIMAGSVIQPGSHIGMNVIVNTKSIIEHDSIIEDHVHIATGVICCGKVNIGRETHIGCGAVILQGVKISANCLIAAGSVVIRDVNRGARVAGVPAKSMG